MIQYLPGIAPADLNPHFLSTLQWFASNVLAHRYANSYHLEILVTSGRREGDSGAHGTNAAVDIRGRFAPTGTKARRILEMWLCGMWAEACARTGWPINAWGFGTYDDDLHFHLDTRTHVSDGLYAAVWVG